MVMEKTLADKKIVMIVAFRDFRDEEYFIPKEILEKNNIEVKTASTETGIAIGADGGEVEIDILIEEINPSNFDAIVFVGGPGCLKYLDNENSYKLVRETISQDKILASICISPIILAKTGVLKEKKATVWSNLLDKKPVRILKKGGAIYQNKPVVVDGELITANGAEAAKKFGKAIVSMLNTRG